MAMMQRVLFHVLAFYAFGNGMWLLIRWAQDTNPFKDNFILVVGLISLLIGLAGFILSFMKLDKKDN
ncbi:hypothetical protein ACJ3XI_07980 [Litorimonas sp. RW-G-Af-16]|uniref:hypothetical protein n=1 Tax=Litorimonas sp. RW-G-Af-16 TaxID=3241168 RepID=UPI00390C8A16